VTLNLAPLLRDAHRLWWSQASAEPTPLVDALVDQVPSIGPVEVFVGLSWNRRLTTDPPAELSFESYGALGSLRRLSADSRLQIIPCHYSAVPRLFAEGQLPTDVGFVQVSPPDADGTCSLGIGVDYAADAAEHTRVLIAEINHRMPSTVGSARIPLSRFAATIETDRPLLEAPSRDADDVERAIAAAVAALVDDGDTIQIGVGSLPGAVLQALRGHRDLGMHSGMIADGVVDLVEAGVLTGARKELDPGVVVTGAALGSQRLYDAVLSLPVRFCATSYTHAPSVLAQLRSLVSINSAIEVDLTGQVGAETRGDIYVGAVGGQSDFSGAAALTGARSIIALRSQDRGESAIKLELQHGSVTTGRSDVDFVVTEHGTAALRGCTLEERARRLILVAAPEHRESLEGALRAQQGARPALEGRLS
jgi:acyl-CoA hydrolase